jgi:hypothetical protein
MKCKDIHQKFHGYFLKNQKVNNAGVQSKNHAYHNVNKVQNWFIDALISNLIGIVVCVVFALYSRENVKMALFLGHVMQSSNLYKL